jgi:hypothetical protein
MLRLRWSTTGAVVGGTIATGAGATMIAVGRDIMMEAMIDADISGAGAPASQKKEGPASGAFRCL